MSSTPFRQASTMTSSHNPTVAVLFGGRTTEREISIKSAHFILTHFPPNFPLIAVGIDTDGRMYRLRNSHTSSAFATCTPADLESLCRGNNHIKNLPAEDQVVPTTILPHLREHLPNLKDMDILNREADVVFPVLHGANGEDGRLQGLLELAEIPYVGCDIRASVVGIDKWIAKRLVAEAGVGITPWVIIDADDWEEKREEYVESIEKVCGYPCFVKPNSAGSSVGVGRVTDRSGLLAKLAVAFTYDNVVLVEPEVGCGSEYHVGYFGTPAKYRLSQLGSCKNEEWLSWDAKYAADTKITYQMPAKMATEEAEELRMATVKVVKALRLCGLSRIDFFRCGKTGQYLFNEVNTMPGFSGKSLFPMLWEASGMAAGEWIAGLVEEARERAVRMWRVKTKLKEEEEEEEEEEDKVVLITNGFA